MSDVINGIFGRPKNETAGTGGYSYGTVEPDTEEAAVVEEADSAPEPEVAEAPSAESVPEETAVVEEADSAPEAETTTETAEDETEDVAEDTAESEDDEAADDEAADDAEDGSEDSEDSEDSEEDVAETEEPAEVVAEDEAEPVAESEPIVESEPVAESAAEAEPVAARPAAGSRGSTTIADGVVGKIVLRIAGRTEGVHSVAEDGVKVELADDVAWVTIPVVIEFGHAVKALGEQLRVAVIDAVEQYLGLDVEVVDVHVTDIHFPEAD